MNTSSDEVKRLFGSPEQLLNKRPLYVALQKIIRNAIQNHELSAGDILPAERDIAGAMNVSRVTVRQAINGLVKDGSLTQRQGAGTFVTKRVEQPLNLIKSFSEVMTELGKTAHSQWLERTVRKPEKAEQVALNLKSVDEVVVIYRQRMANEKVMALEMSTVIRASVLNPLEVRGSLYKAMEQTSHRPTKAKQRLRAINIDSTRAKLLDVELNAAVFYIERIGYLNDGTAVEFTQSWFPGDSYEFVAEILQPA